MIYGKPKIGKSTVAAGFPAALFLDCEGGLNALETFRVPILTWADFLQACAEIAKGGHGFQTIVIDTIDQAYARCREHVLAKAGLSHESDGEFGKAYDLVTAEFQRVMAKLAVLPSGLVLITHATEKEFRTRTGRQVRIVPTLPNRAAKTVLAMCDFLLYCDFEDSAGPKGEPSETRVFRTKPTSYYDAGDRTGLLPESIPLDYTAFAAAVAKAINTKHPPVLREVDRQADPPRVLRITNPETQAAIELQPPVTASRQPAPVDADALDLGVVIEESVPGVGYTLAQALVDDIFEIYGKSKGTRVYDKLLVRYGKSLDLLTLAETEEIRAIIAKDQAARPASA
jgi:hypothetical protein